MQIRAEGEQEVREKLNKSNPSSVTKLFRIYELFCHTLPLIRLGIEAPHHLSHSVLSLRYFAFTLLFFSSSFGSFVYFPEGLLSFALFFSNLKTSFRQISFVRLECKYRFIYELSIDELGRRIASEKSGRNSDGFA